MSSPRTLEAFIEAFVEAAKLLLNVSSIFFPNSANLSNIAWSTVPSEFGGTFNNNGALWPTELKYIFPKSARLLGVFFLVPQNHPDVIRASASGTVHLLPFSYPNE